MPTLRAYKNFLLLVLAILVSFKKINANNQYMVWAFFYYFTKELVKQDETKHNKIVSKKYKNWDHSSGMK